MVWWTMLLKHYVYGKSVASVWELCHREEGYISGRGFTHYILVDMLSVGLVLYSCFAKNEKNMNYD